MLAEIKDDIQCLADLPDTFLKMQEGNLQGNQTALEILENTHLAPAINSGFIGMYYDDNSWWALAWIRAYDLTKQQPNLDSAEHSFEEMTTGWDDVCNGGIWSNTDRTYKNAIANELFFSVASSLANRVPNKRSYYLNWAIKELKWFQQSGMMNSHSTINDGLKSSCQNDHETVWSYNQGVILGGLVELNEVYPNSSNLFLININSLWNSARYPNTTFGDSWAGPLDDVNVMS